MTTKHNDTVDGRTVLRSLREPVVVVAGGDTIVFANRRFLDVTQSSRAAVVGADCALLERYVAAGYDDLRAAIDAVADGSVDEGRVECEIDHPSAAPVARRLPVEIRVSPAVGDDLPEGVVLVFRDVRERAAYERELERQNDRLEEFAGVVSHDLRSPLNVAAGRVELARAEGGGEHLDAAHDALDRMDELVDDLLTLARRGDCRGETSAVDLGRVAADCWRTIETDGASLVVDADARVRADEGRLRQLLSNLLRNSVEHGGDGVTVTVGALTDGTGFYVEDDGPGVPSEERDRVLEPGCTLSADGTGLGLNIVANVADAHGWDLVVTESDHGGARFEFGNVERLDP